MIRRELGSTGMVISAVGFGAWAIGGWMWGDQDDADSRAAIAAALDAGVDWIDTAPIYGSGRSERLVGEALRALPSDRRPLVFTKFGLGADSANRRQSATRADIVGECEASLGRLGIERIDLYQLHWPVPQPVDEVAGACADLLKAGKVRAIGVCNYSVEQLAAWQATKLPLHCLQTPYSLLRPASGDTVLPWCAEHGIGGLAYSPLMRGMLFGTWTAEKTFPPGDTRAEHKDYRGARFARHLAAIDELKRIAAEDDLTLPQLAIGALMCTPGLTACIVGARNAAQGAALGELGAPIRAKQLAAVDEVCARLAADLATIA
ncbi:MAG TPA: aldo/keto reductase [Planctomycetota bacterium]|nr:aldo/keto reductase [Planctomycetota bacterium]